MVSDWRLYYAKANYLTINLLPFTSFSFNLVSWKMNVDLGCFQLFNDLTRAQDCPLFDRSLSLCMFSTFLSIVLSFYQLRLLIDIFLRRSLPFPLSLSHCSLGWCAYLLLSAISGVLYIPFPFSLCHFCLAFLFLSKFA